MTGNDNIIKHARYSDYVRSYKEKNLEWWTEKPCKNLEKPSYEDQVTAWAA